MQITIYWFSYVIQKYTMKIGRGHTCVRVCTCACARLCFSTLKSMIPVLGQIAKPMTNAASA